MNFIGIDLDHLRILVYVSISMLLGAVIGIDRELVGKPTGLHTPPPMTGATTLLIALSDVSVIHFQTSFNILIANLVRIMQVVVIRGSFLGAGCEYPFQGYNLKTHM